MIGLLPLFGEFASGQIANQNAVVKIPLVVVRNGKIAPAELKSQDISVTDNKQSLNVELHSVPASEVTVGLLIDWSGSVSSTKEKRAAWILQNVRELVGALPTGTKFLVGIIYKSQRGFSRPTSDLSQVLGSVNRLVGAMPEGQTSLYDGIVDLEEFLQKSDPVNRHVLVLFTDGQDNSSRLSFKQMVEKLRQDNPLVFCIDVANSENLGPGSSDVGLVELAEPSGGKVFYPSLGEGVRPQDEISAALAPYMELAVVLATAPNSKHDIKVEFTESGRLRLGPDVNVHYRRKYYY